MGLEVFNNMATNYRDELIATAKTIGTPGKGILAADESTGTIGKRFDNISVENTEANRRAYRDLLFTTEGLEQYISGVIMYEETLSQSTTEGKSFVDVLQSKGIVVGIKVDLGVKTLRGTDGETMTQGFDNLDARCAKYYQQGARFAKWRAVLKIGNGCPSNISVKENANGLARYAAICQDNGLVPIVEPEVLMDGDHTIEETVRVTEHVLAEVYKALHDANVLLEGSILKTNLVCPGSSCPTQVSPEQVGHATVTVLQRTLPCAVPTVNFLSGGLSEESASVYLNAMNALKLQKPWNLSFSYGRALQATCLKVWGGKAENVAAAQEALLVRSKANSEASLGVYQGDSNASTESLFVSNYVY